jgi:hypothetical protein
LTPSHGHGHERRATDLSSSPTHLHATTASELLSPSAGSGGGGGGMHDDIAMGGSYGASLLSNEKKKRKSKREMERERLQREEEERRLEEERKAREFEAWKLANPTIPLEYELEFGLFLWNSIGSLFQSKLADDKALVSFWVPPIYSSPFKSIVMCMALCCDVINSVPNKFMMIISSN